MGSACSYEAAPAEGAAPAGLGAGPRRRFSPQQHRPARRSRSAASRLPRRGLPRPAPRPLRPRPRLALWAGADWGAAGGVRPLQTRPAPRGRGGGGWAKRTAPPARAASPPPTPSRPRPVLPRPPPLGGVGRAAADSHFGAEWGDVTGETRAAPGTGAGAGGGGRVSGHLAAGRGGEGSGRPLPRRRVPRGGGEGKWAPPRRSGSPLRRPLPGLWARACARAPRRCRPFAPPRPGPPCSLEGLAWECGRLGLPSAVGGPACLCDATGEGT